MSATKKTTTPDKGAMESEKNLENDLRNIVEGVGQRQQMQESSAAFLRSNYRHKIADVFFALSTYTFSGLLHVHGQSTALTSLSLWAAGTTFLLNMQVRKVFDLPDETKRRQVETEMNLQERNVFQLEMVASWVWMLSSMQQFKLHRRMKYCGYSSWMGLGTCMYFTLRHAYNVLLLE
ncbi:uncharacterized protein TM35_000192110 [Trypanosoma theileri]|uniref:Uncharacterized protein n=1 Tax=Trypanosoma theileri TaxID=67003 RepID=A0A1X0NTC5_9TRYP|nr:uncharacterized protein TM35_000192110 [Trypanosoma theileri]ORC87967.1 hypothetical protein TM35_000192110 [Trypanosoma theileri]